MGNVDNTTVELTAGTTDNNWVVRNNGRLTGNVSFPGDLTIDVDSRSLVQLTGRVTGSLYVNRINGASTIQLFELTAGKVVFRVKVDGQSSATVQSLGDVHLADGVNGQSHFKLVMVGGGNVLVDGWIDGQSTVDLDLTGTVDKGGGDTTFTGKIDGQSHVTISNAGTRITGKEVSGGSVVTCNFPKTQTNAASLVSFNPVHNGARVDVPTSIQLT